MRPNLRVELGDKAAAFFVDPQSLTSWPVERDRDDYFVLDGAFPQFEIGPGVEELRSGVRQEWSQAPDQSPSASPDANPTNATGTQRSLLVG